MDLNWFNKFAIQIIQEIHSNQQFKTVLVPCTGLVRFAISHTSVKTLKMILCIIHCKIIKTDTYFHFNSVSFFTLHCFFEFICNTLMLLSNKSCIPIVFFKTTKHANFLYTKLRIWSSCCSGLNQQWTWFLRIIQWT